MKGIDNMEPKRFIHAGIIQTEEETSYILGKLFVDGFRNCHSRYISDTGYEIIILEETGRTLEDMLDALILYGFKNARIEENK